MGEVAHREFADVGYARFQRLGHVQVALAELRQVRNIAEDFQPHLDAEVTRFRWNPRRADHFVPAGWNHHFDGRADRIEGQADTEVCAAELHPHDLWHIADVAQFDADFRRFTRARRVGPDVNLRFGEEGVLRAMERHGRPIELAETADQHAVNVAFHVGDDLPRA